MTPSSSARIRRPAAHESLIQQFIAEAGFGAIRDVLIFTAVLGASVDRRVEFGESAEPIRYDTLVDRRIIESLIAMIAVTDSSSNATVLAADGLDDRVRAFEACVNGGLEFVSEELQRGGEALDEVLLRLVRSNLSEQ